MHIDVRPAAKLGGANRVNVVAALEPVSGALATSDPGSGPFSPRRAGRRTVKERAGRL